jgi:hypothetical protein
MWPYHRFPYGMGIDYERKPIYGGSPRRGPDGG